MLGWAFAFLGIALIAGITGFGVVPSASVGVAQRIFFIFTALFIGTIAALALQLRGDRLRRRHDGAGRAMAPQGTGRTKDELGSDRG